LNVPGRGRPELREIKAEVGIDYNHAQNVIWKSADAIFEFIDQ
jgi:hypothetical protein